MFVEVRMTRQKTGMVGGGKAGWALVAYVTFGLLTRVGRPSFLGFLLLGRGDWSLGGIRGRSRGGRHVLLLGSLVGRRHDGAMRPVARW